MYRPFKTQRRPIGSLLTGAIICVVLGFLLGIVYLAILGRYGVPFWVAGMTYCLSVTSAFLVWAGMLRGE